MLFLALPPADMLPPAGHRAGPGRAHTGPITRSGRPGGRPRVSPRAPVRPPRGQGCCPTKSLKLLLSGCPRPPRSSRPRHGGRGPGPGWHRPEKSVRGKSRPGVGGARRPGVAPDPTQVPGGSPSGAPAPEHRHPQLRASWAPLSAGGCRVRARMCALPGTAQGARGGAARWALHSGAGHLLSGIQTRPTPWGRILLQAAYGPAKPPFHWPLLPQVKKTSLGFPSRSLYILKTIPFATLS